MATYLLYVNPALKERGTNVLWFLMISIREEGLLSSFLWPLMTVCDLTCMWTAKSSEELWKLLVLSVTVMLSGCRWEGCLMFLMQDQNLSKNNKASVFICALSGEVRSDHGSVDTLSNSREILELTTCDGISESWKWRLLLHFCIMNAH